MDLNSRVLIKDNETFKTTDINELKQLSNTGRKMITFSLRMSLI